MIRYNLGVEDSEDYEGGYGPCMNDSLIGKYVFYEDMRAEVRSLEAVIGGSVTKVTSLKCQVRQEIARREAAESRARDMCQEADRLRSLKHYAALELSDRRLDEIKTILKLGADEGPVYCDKPECIVASIRTALADHLIEQAEGGR